MNDFFDRIAGINWLISVLGAIVLSILANLLTNPIRNKLAKLSVKRSKKRIHQLKVQLSKIEALVTTPANLYSYISLSIVRIIIVALVAFAIRDITSASMNAYVGISQNSTFRTSVLALTWFLYSAAQFITSLLYVVGINTENNQESSNIQ